MNRREIRAAERRLRSAHDNLEVLLRAAFPEGTRVGVLLSARQLGRTNGEVISIPWSNPGCVRVRCETAKGLVRDFHWTTIRKL